jgi:hypothetical protein
MFHVYCFFFFFFRKSGVCEITWKRYGRAREATDDNLIGRMRIVRLITTATNTHLKYVILIIFPRQQWLSERSSMLVYSTLSCLMEYQQTYLLKKVLFVRIDVMSVCCLF